MNPLSRNASEILATLSSRSKGVVTRAELLDAGLSANQVRSRVRQGALIREYPGVYRVGHGAPSAEATYLAAVRACGIGSALSGAPASWLLRLVKGKPPAPEVSAPFDRRIDGLKTRRRRLERGDIIICRGIPVTSVPLTLLDLAPLLALEDLALACHEAGVKYRTTPRDVARALTRRPNAKGATKLRRVLEGEPVSLSKLESRFLQLLREAGLPLPTTNKVASGRRVDCRWPEHKLTVELDSYRFHNSRHSWEQDRRRERQAYARGDDFRRFSYDDVFVRPRVVLREAVDLFKRPSRR